MITLNKGNLILKREISREIKAHIIDLLEKTHIK